MRSDQVQTESRNRQPSPALVSVCACIAVILFTGMAYSPLLTAGFVDSNDRHYVAASRYWAGYYRHAERFLSERWKDAGELFIRGSVHTPDGTGGYYQPLVILSYMADVLLTRDWNSAGFQFHLTNLLLHLLNVALVFALVQRLAGRTLWSILLSLMFALHPVQVETVAWISQRMTLLGGMFSLIALNCYLRYVRSSRRAWLIALMISYAGGILCRPLFIALPVVLLILDVWPFQRKGLQPIIDKVPLFLLMFAGAILQIVVRSDVVPIQAGGADGGGMILHQLAALITRLFWPAGLSPYQPLASTVGGRALGMGFDLCLMLLIVAALVWSIHRCKPLFAALAGGMVLLLPALLQAPLVDRLLSDQYLYGALIVPLIVVAARLRRGERITPTRKRWLAIGLASMLAIFSVQSYNQTFAWRSSRALFEQTRSIYPDWAFGYIGLVESYIQERDLDSALVAAEQAVRVEPGNPSTQYYLGTVMLLHRDGRSAEAIEPLRKALVSDPDWIECLQNLGVALARNGRTAEAIEFLERARDLDPRSAGIRVGLGNAYLKVHRFASARGEFQEALRQRNDSAAHLGLAIAWAANDRPDYARRHLAAAVAKDPESAERAGRSSELRRYREHPGFDTLLKISEDATEWEASPVTESPAARRAHGS